MREQEARPSLGARVPCPAPAASALRPPAEEGWRKRYLRTELLPKEGQGHLVRMQHSSGLTSSGESSRISAASLARSPVRRRHR